MTIHNNKIVEATESELFSVYLEREYDEIMSFPDYVLACKRNGTVVTDTDEPDSE